MRVSQPSSMRPLQSARSERVHASIAQTPPAHVARAFGPTTHAAPHPPQFDTVSSGVSQPGSPGAQSP